MSVFYIFSLLAFLSMVFLLFLSWVLFQRMDACLEVAREARDLSIGKIKGLFFRMRKYPMVFFNPLQPQINRNEERSLSKSGD